MLYAESKGKFYSEEDSGDLSPWEIETIEIHESEENQEKKLFDYMYEMIK